MYTFPRLTSNLNNIPDVRGDGRSLADRGTPGAQNHEFNWAIVQLFVHGIGAHSRIALYNGCRVHVVMWGVIFSLSWGVGRGLVWRVVWGVVLGVAWGV